MLKWYNIYQEVWYKETRVTKYFIQSLFCEETQVFERTLKVDWSIVEDWYKKGYKPRGLYIAKTKYGYGIAIIEKFSSRKIAKKPIVKQWEDPELDLQIRHRYYEAFPSIEDVMDYPNKIKVAQWLKEQGIMIQE